MYFCRIDCTKIPECSLFYSIKDQDGRFFEYFSSVHVGDLGAAPSELDEADGNFNRYKHGVGGKALM